MDQNQHTCKNHPDAPAVAQCCVCGDWFCADCVATVGDKVYCKSHVHETFSRDTAKGEEPPEISPYSRTVALLLCFFCGLIGLHLFYTGYVGRGITKPNNIKTCYYTTRKGKTQWMQQDLTKRAALSS